MTVVSFGHGGRGVERQVWLGIARDEEHAEILVVVIAFSPTCTGAALDALSRRARRRASPASSTSTIISVRLRHACSTLLVKRGSWLGNTLNGRVSSCASCFCSQSVAALAGS